MDQFQIKNLHNEVQSLSEIADYQHNMLSLIQICNNFEEKNKLLSCHNKNLVNDCNQIKIIYNQLYDKKVKENEDLKIKIKMLEETLVQMYFLNNSK